MRIFKILGIIVLCIYGISVKAQEKTKQIQDSSIKEMVWIVVEEMPIFPGGDDSLICYIESQLDFKLINSIDTTGCCYYTFKIDSIGQSHFLQVHRPISKQLDNEIERIINSLPIWTPGKMRGKDVSVNFTIPINIPYKINCKR